MKSLFSIWNKIKKQKPGRSHVSYRKCCLLHPREQAGSYTTLRLISHRDPVYRGTTSQMGMAFLCHSSSAISFLCRRNREEHGHYEEMQRSCLEGFWETSGAPAFAVQVGACRKNKGMARFPSGASTAATTDDSTPHLSPLLTTQKSSWGKLTGLLKTVHQVGTKIIYENYYFFSLKGLISVLCLFLPWVVSKDGS